MLGAAGLGRWTEVPEHAEVVLESQEETVSVRCSQFRVVSTIQTNSKVTDIQEFNNYLPTYCNFLVVIARSPREAVRTL